MIGNRFNGDNIAHEFENILKKNRSLNKKAQAIFESSAEDDPVEAVMDYEPENSLPDPESFLMSLEAEDDISDALDGSIDNMSSSESCANYGQAKYRYNKSSALGGSDLYNRSSARILNGLGKIAGSLRSKGHLFASDIVESTAMSIKDDLVKEAKNKARVTNELRKMAKELSASGNIIASDMIMITIGKIKKSAMDDKYDKMTDSEIMDGSDYDGFDVRCETCVKEGVSNAVLNFDTEAFGIGYSRMHEWLCAKHLKESSHYDAEFAEETFSNRPYNFDDYEEGSPSDNENDFSIKARLRAKNKVKNAAGNRHPFFTEEEYNDPNFFADKKKYDAIYPEAGKGTASHPFQDFNEDICEECAEEGMDDPTVGMGYSRDDKWLCIAHLEAAAGDDQKYDNYDVHDFAEIDGKNNRLRRDENSWRPRGDDDDDIFREKGTYKQDRLGFGDEFDTDKISDEGLMIELDGDFADEEKTVIN